MISTKTKIILRNKLRNENFKNKLFKAITNKDFESLIIYEDLKLNVEELKKFKLELITNMINYNKTNIPNYNENNSFSLEFFLNNFKDQEKYINSSKCLYTYLKKLRNLKELITDEVILEFNLNNTNNFFDLSFKIDKKFIKPFSNQLEKIKIKNNIIWDRIYNIEKYWKENLLLLNNIWLEIDYETIDQIIEPCIFLDASIIQMENKYFYALENLIDSCVLIDLANNLKKCINKLPQNVQLYQFGVMLSRKQNCVRLFTNEMTTDEIIAYLKALNWNGNFKKLLVLFNFLNLYSDKQYILDFDVFKDLISSKIGINFSLDYNKSNILILFLRKLVDMKLCNRENIEKICSFISSNDKNILKYISHFKISVENDLIYTKIYLKLIPNMEWR